MSDGVAGREWRTPALPSGGVSLQKRAPFSHRFDPSSEERSSHSTSNGKIGRGREGRKRSSVFLPESALEEESPHIDSHSDTNDTDDKSESVFDAVDDTSGSVGGDDYSSLSSPRSDLRSPGVPEIRDESLGGGLEVQMARIPLKSPVEQTTRSTSKRRLRDILNETRRIRAIPRLLHSRESTVGSAKSSFSVKSELEGATSSRKGYDDSRIKSGFQSQRALIRPTLSKGPETHGASRSSGITQSAQQKGKSQSRSKAKKRISSTWREFMTHMLTFMVLILFLVGPMSVWTVKAFFYGSIWTLSDTILVHHSLLVHSDGRIGINTEDPQALLHISNPKEEPSIMRISSVIDDSNDLRSLSQAIQFGVYDSSAGGAFISGVSLQHVFSSDGLNSQLQVGGGEMAVSRSLLVAGEVSLKGKLRIGNEADTSLVTGDDGRIILSGDFLDIRNSYGAFVVAREDFELFRVENDGSFTIQGNFMADEVVAYSQIQAKSMQIVSSGDQSSYVASTSGDCVIAMESPSGFVNKLSLSVGNQSYSFETSTTSSFHLYQNAEQRIMISDGGAIELDTQDLMVTSKKAVEASFTSDSKSSNLKLHAAENSNATFTLEVLDTQISLSQSSDGKFEWQYNSVPFFSFFDGTSEIHATSIMMENNAGGMDLEVKSNTGNAEVVVENECATDMHCSSGLMFSSGYSSTNFSMKNEGAGRFVLEGDTTEILALDASSLSSIQLGIHAEDILFEANAAQSFEIRSDQGNASLLIDAFSQEASLHLNAGMHHFEVANLGSSVVGESAGTMKIGYRYVPEGETEEETQEDFLSLMRFVKAEKVMIDANDLEITGSVDISGDLNVNGRLLIDNGEAGVYFGENSIGGALLIYRNEVSGNIRITGDVVVESKLIVEGSANVKGGTTLDKYLHLSQAVGTSGNGLILGASTSTLTKINRESVESSRLVTDGSFLVSGDMEVGGDCTIGGAMYARGDFQFMETGNRIVWAAGTEDEVSLFSPEQNVMKTPNSFHIDGSLTVSRDISVDGIVYASVSVNPGYVLSEIGIPTAWSESGVRKVYVGDETSSSQGKDGKTLVAFVFTEVLEGGSTTNYIGVLHCFDVSCSVNRKYEVVEESTSTTRIQGKSPSVFVGPDGLLRMMWIDDSTASVDGTYHIRIGACATTSCPYFTTGTMSSLYSQVGEIDSLRSTLGVDGNVHFVFRDVMTNTLYSKHCTDADLSAVCSVITSTSSLTNVDGDVRFGYQFNGYPLFFFRRDSKLCSIATGDETGELDELNVNCLSLSGGQYISQTLAKDGYPVILHSDGSAMKILHCDSSDCSGSVSEEALSADLSYGPSAAAIGSDGHATFVWSTQSKDVINFLHCNSADCSDVTSMPMDTQTFAGGNEISGEPVLSIGGDGLPFAIFKSVDPNAITPEETSDLRAAHCSNEMCVPYLRRR